MYNEHSNVFFDVDFKYLWIITRNNCQVLCCIDSLKDMDIICKTKGIMLAEKRIKQFEAYIHTYTHRSIHRHTPCSQQQSKAPQPAD